MAEMKSLIQVQDSEEDVSEPDHERPNGGPNLNLNPSDSKELFKVQRPTFTSGHPDEPDVLIYNEARTIRAIISITPCLESLFDQETGVGNYKMFVMGSYQRGLFIHDMNREVDPQW